MGKVEVIHNFCTNYSPSLDNSPDFVFPGRPLKCQLRGSKADTGHGAGLNCTGSCGNGGPDIRFPFRIKGKQPDHCGYLGFDLSCSDDNSTVLELPTGVRLHIEEIDYRFRLIYARDPLGCFPRKRLNFSLGASHFQIKNDWLHDWTFFNCSPNEKRFTYSVKIPCLSAFNHDVYAVESYDTISDSDLLSCTKMYNIHGFPYGMLREENYRLTISWFNPTCGSSEAECYGFLKHSVRRKLLITG
ncbi:RING-H2 FINGER PROTEIN ATL21A-RELATED [Salix koriyanagi]|uniref:RING-type E3 ubiquitin transferase n=1 Tax=Salix koriyanagi TaxID=2511006 RepID=A0A9Q0SVM3_9ROSI|nr:RING-H2 FINGER PROTEIN ATL21A-RELATED [Salix koriyanagi]